MKPYESPPRIQRLLKKAQRICSFWVPDAQIYRKIFGELCEKDKYHTYRIDDISIYLVKSFTWTAINMRTTIRSEKLDRLGKQIASANTIAKEAVTTASIEYCVKTDGEIDSELKLYAALTVSRNRFKAVIDDARRSFMAELMAVATITFNNQ